MNLAMERGISPKSLLFASRAAQTEHVESCDERLELLHHRPRQLERIQMVAEGLDDLPDPDTVRLQNEAISETGSLERKDRLTDL